MANCKLCGAPLDEGQSFCTQCGAPVNGDSAATPVNQAAAPMDQPVPAPMNASGQSNYQVPPVTPPAASTPLTLPPTRDNEVVSLGDWMITMLLLCIPVVNLVMLFVWAFGSDVPESKSNWAKARLIWTAIGIVLGLISTVAFLGTIAAIVSEFG